MASSVYRWLDELGSNVPPIYILRLGFLFGKVAFLGELDIVAL